MASSDDDDGGDSYDALYEPSFLFDYDNYLRNPNQGHSGVGPNEIVEPEGKDKP